MSERGQDADEGVAPDPWPDSDRVVFLADAANRVERSILRRWISDTAPVGAGRPEMVTISHDLTRGAVRSEIDKTLDDRDPSTQLVPIRVAWLPSRDPERSLPRVRDLMVGDPRHPATQFVRALQRTQPNAYTCVSGEPATIGDLRARYDAAPAGSSDVEAFPGFVRRQGELSLDVAERLLRGRRYKVPRYVMEGVATSPGYGASVEKLAAQLDRPVEDVRAESEDSLREMIATPSAFFIDWVGTLTRRIRAVGYQRVVVDPENVARARQAVRDNPTVLLWTHKSHMDGIVLLSVLYDNDFPTPHSLGGINMAMGPVGFFGRRAGIIYIRRSFSDSPVYKAALQQYLGFLMRKRFPFSWAFEGTRSRTGKLGKPRYGLLKYVIDAAHTTGAENVHLVPVNISYDLIGETADYASEEAGRQKQAESFGWFMGYLNRLRAPSGNIYLDFGDPVVLEGPAPEATPETLQQAAFEVARRANAQVPVTMPALLCLALLDAHPRSLTYDELDRSMRELVRWLRDRSIRMVDGLAGGDTAEIEALAEHTFASGVVTRHTEGEEPLFSIGSDAASVAGYYRNTIIHYFVNKALCDLALQQVVDTAPQERVEAFWRELHWLRDATKFEFYHTPTEEIGDEITAELVAVEPDWEQVLAGSREDVEALIERFRPLVAHTVLLPFLGAYWIVLRVLAEARNEKESGRSAVVGRALRLGETAYRKRELSTRSSISKETFHNAYTFAESQGLLDPDAEDADVRRRELADRVGRLMAACEAVGRASHAVR